MTPASVTRACLSPIGASVLLRRLAASFNTRRNPGEQLPQCDATLTRPDDKSNTVMSFFTPSLSRRLQANGPHSGNDEDAEGNQQRSRVSACAAVIITLRSAVIYLGKKSYGGLFNTSAVKLTRIPGEQLRFQEEETVMTRPDWKFYTLLMHISCQLSIVVVGLYLTLS